ncbi:MAG: copper-binding protein [Betaproteobacteria bacterium]
MNYLKSALIAAAIAATMPLAALAAGEHKDEHHAEAKAAVPMAEGEVRKIDRDASKITIKHGEIKSIDMPPMTMVFQVKDAALFDKVKAGDKVRFAAEKTATGYGVTAIEVAK